MVSWIKKYPWLKEAVKQDRRGEDDLAIQSIYANLNKRFRAKRLDNVEQLLLDIRVSELSADLLLAFLTATLAYHPFLKTRANFFARVKRAFDRRGTPGLLTGLG